MSGHGNNYPSLKFYSVKCKGSTTNDQDLFKITDCTALLSSPQTKNKMLPHASFLRNSFNMWHFYTNAAIRLAL